MEPKAFTDKVSQNFRDPDENAEPFQRRFYPHHRGAPLQGLPSAVERIDEKRRYLSPANTPDGTRCADEAYYSEDELKEGPNGKKIAPSGAECEWLRNRAISSACRHGAKVAGFYDANPILSYRITAATKS